MGVFAKQDAAEHWGGTIDLNAVLSPRFWFKGVMRFNWNKPMQGLRCKADENQNTSLVKHDDRAITPCWTKQCQGQHDLSVNLQVGGEIVAAIDARIDGFFRVFGFTVPVEWSGGYTFQALKKTYDIGTWCMYLFPPKYRLIGSSTKFNESSCPVQNSLTKPTRTGCDDYCAFTAGCKGYNYAPETENCSYFDQNCSSLVYNAEGGAGYWDQERTLSPTSFPTFPAEGESVRNYTNNTNTTVDEIFDDFFDGFAPRIWKTKRPSPAPRSYESEDDSWWDFGPLNDPSEENHFDNPSVCLSRDGGRRLAEVTTDYSQQFMKKMSANAANVDLRKGLNKHSIANDDPLLFKHRFAHHDPETDDLTYFEYRAKRHADVVHLDEIGVVRNIECERVYDGSTAAKDNARATVTLSTNDIEQTYVRMMEVGAILVSNEAHWLSSEIDGASERGGMRLLVEGIESVSPSTLVFKGSLVAFSDCFEHHTIEFFRGRPETLHVQSINQTRPSI